MPNNEIKKILYKEKPIARFKDLLFNSRYMYITNCSAGTIIFIIPRKEMGENVFESKIPAQLLIRWIV